MSIAGEHAGVSSLDQNLAAIAIVFDFVNPECQGGQLDAMAARDLSRNVEAVVMALEKRGVEITETGVQLTAKRRR